MSEMIHSGNTSTEFIDVFSEFDEAISVDMEFSAQCVAQYRLDAISMDFSVAGVPEFICLREHPCCRNRLALVVVKNSERFNKEEALFLIKEYFLNEKKVSPISREGLAGFQPAPKLIMELPKWYRDGKCIKEPLLDELNDHLGDRYSFPIEELQAMYLHMQKCVDCTSRVKSLPNVSLRQF